MSKLENEDRERLLQFFGGYFHQDCKHQYDTYDSAMSQYFSDAGVEDKKSLQRAVEQLRSSKYGEKRIEKMITDEFGCSVWPVKLRGRTWLSEIMERLNTELP